MDAINYIFLAVTVLLAIGVSATDVKIRYKFELKCGLHSNFDADVRTCVQTSNWSNNPRQVTKSFCGDTKRNYWASFAKVFFTQSEVVFTQGVSGQTLPIYTQIEHTCTPGRVRKYISFPDKGQRLNLKISEKGPFKFEAKAVVTLDNQGRDNFVFE